MNPDLGKGFTFAADNMEEACEWVRRSFLPGNYFVSSGNEFREVNTLPKIPRVRLKFYLNKAYRESNSYYYECALSDKLVRSRGYIETSSRKEAKEKLKQIMSETFTLDGELIDCVFFN